MADTSNSEHSDFFDEKKPWSRIKDSILGEYLKPYLRKVKEVGQGPIVIVDGFAGPGRTRKDQLDGSPLIICKLADATGVAISATFVEINPEYVAELKRHLAPWVEKGIAHIETGDFRKVLPRVLSTLGRRPLFLYLDPFGVVGIEMTAIQEVISRANRKDVSTEILVNFSYPHFIRLTGNWNPQSSPDEISRKVQQSKVEEANAVMGGDYWKRIIVETTDPLERETRVVEAYASQFRRSFNFVGSCPVKDLDENIAKYHLIFGSRHPAAIILMSDIMHRAYEKYLFSYYKAGNLIDTRPETKDKDFDLLDREIVTAVSSERLTREEIKARVVPKLFMRFQHTDYTNRIEALLHQRQLFASNGKSERIGEDAQLSTTPFPASESLAIRVLTKLVVSGKLVDITLAAGGILRGRLSPHGGKSFKLMLANGGGDRVLTWQDFDSQWIRKEAHRLKVMV